MADTINPEVLSELNVEARTVLAFFIDEELIGAAQLLPQGWVAAAPGGGPFKGANLLIIVSDRLLIQDKESKPLTGQETNQLAVVAVLAQQVEGTEKGVVISFGLSAKTQAAPGPYEVFEPAEASVKKAILVKDGDATTEEEWHFKSAAQNLLSLQLTYTRGTPVRDRDAVTRAYSLAKPDFYRVYHADQGADLLHSHTSGVNRISRINYQITGPRLDKLFNGAEKLLSVVSQPWTVRSVFVKQ